MIEDIAGAAIEGLAEVASADSPDRRKRPGCWWLYVTVLGLIAVFVIIALLRQ
jgi:hypothetical protein